MLTKSESEMFTTVYRSYGKWFIDSFALSAGAVEYTGCFFPGGNDSPKECPGYDIKQSDGEVPVMLELWEMWRTALLPSHWPGVVAPDRTLSMG